jgi:hypothetical protein
MKDKTLGENKLERCGFCGRWFRGNKYLTLEEIKETTDKKLNNAPLGFCPEAGYEDEKQNPQPQRVTKDMATDAEIPELEGELL